MNVLVTGITGFIGSRLAARLVSEGHNVFGLVRHSSERALKRLQGISSRVHIVEGDLGQYDSVLSAVRSSKPDLVFHLGALTPVRLSFDDPFPYLNANFDGTVNVVHAVLRETPNTRVLAASTAEVYGWQEGQKPIPEDVTLKPASPYAVTKAAADQYIQMANRVFKLRGTVLRPINSYGRTAEKGFFIEYLISNMLAGRECFVGTPDSVRDYMFCEDHVSAYIKAAEAPSAVGRVYNVSPGNPVTNAQVTKQLAELTGFKGKIVFGSYPQGYPQRPQSEDPSYLVLDKTRISQELGWKPEYSLQRGLEATVGMWKEKD